MRTPSLIALLSLLFVSSAHAAISTAEASRLREASAVLAEFHNASDKGIPEDLWNRAQCVVVVPSLKKAAFILGGEYGKGVMSCRTGKGWSAPVFMELEKGSLGFQVGGEQIDLVLVVLNRRGVEKMLQDKVTLGADASVAAGPLGRTAAAATDAQMAAEILSYSRSQGLFAGIDVSGGALRPDKGANEDVYGPSHSPREIAEGARVKVPAEAKQFLATLSRESRPTTGKK